MCSNCMSQMGKYIMYDMVLMSSLTTHLLEGPCPRAHRLRPMLSGAACISGVYRAPDSMVLQL